jgi:putative mycofactocin binding protein MftB
MTAATAVPQAFDADRPWRLHARVALRPEPFGALAYHYGNRRLTFLRSPDLVALVEALPGSPSARGAFDAAGLDARRWPSFEKALTSLAAGEFLVPADAPSGEGTPAHAEPTDPTGDDR